MPKKKPVKKADIGSEDAVTRSLSVPLSSEAPAQAPVVLTPAQQEEGDRRFVAAAESVAARYGGTITQILLAHWETGKLVDSMVVQPMHWGNATVQKLAEYLEGKGGIKAGGMSVASLYAYRQFFNAYPELEHVRHLAGLKMGWWIINRILPWSKEDRDKFEIDYPKLTPDEVATIISDKSKALPAPSSGKKKSSDGHKIRAILSVFGAVSGICADLNSRLGEIPKAIKVWKEDEDEARRSEFAKAVKDMEKALGTTVDRVGVILKELK